MNRIWKNYSNFFTKNFWRSSMIYLHLLFRDFLILFVELFIVILHIWIDFDEKFVILESLSYFCLFIHILDSGIIECFRPVWWCSINHGRKWTNCLVNTFRTLLRYLNLKISTITSILGTIHCLSRVVIGWFRSYSFLYIARENSWNVLVDFFEFWASVTVGKLHKLLFFLCFLHCKDTLFEQNHVAYIVCCLLHLLFSNLLLDIVRQIWSITERTFFQKACNSWITLRFLSLEWS